MLECNGDGIIVYFKHCGVMGARLGSYSMSKHAVIGLMKSAAKEFGSQNIQLTP